jgi:sugar phosphate isomerase/epimerase
MNVNYTCTYWGCEQQTAKEFLANVVKSGYRGVEINFPDDAHFVAEFMTELERIRKTIDRDFIFIAQQVLSNQNESVEDYLKRIKSRLEFLAALKPTFINSHTGKDYYDFSDNCRIIDCTAEIASKSGIPIVHEIHRGRFTFHLKTLLSYLDRYPTLKLVADLSHFCVVSESNLEDQQELLVKLYPNIHHIHARIGFEQSPQVNNPFAPEWKSYLDRYLGWWEEVLKAQTVLHLPLTITPEFGPFPYMSEAPFTKEPLSNQWEINLQMKHYLQQNLFKNG